MSRKKVVFWWVCFEPEGLTATRDEEEALGQLADGVLTGLHPKVLVATDDRISRNGARVLRRSLGVTDLPEYNFWIDPLLSFDHLRPLTGVPSFQDQLREMLEGREDRGVWPAIRAVKNTCVPWARALGFYYDAFMRDNARRLLEIYPDDDQIVVLGVTRAPGPELAHPDPGFSDKLMRHLEVIRVTVGKDECLYFDYPKP